MIIGTPAYFPQGQFAFPRSYVEQFTFGFGAGAIITHTDGDFFITDGTNPIVHVVCRLYPNFWAWNSNRYTLDYVISDWWLLIDPDPTPQPLNFQMFYRYDAPSNKPELFLNLAGATTRYSFALPPAPPSYWTPT